MKPPPKVFWGYTVLCLHVIYRRKKKNKLLKSNDKLVTKYIQQQLQEKERLKCECEMYTYTFTFAIFFNVPKTEHVESVLWTFPKPTRIHSLHTSSDIFTPNVCTRSGLDVIGVIEFKFRNVFFPHLCLENVKNHCFYYYLKVQKNSKYCFYSLN